MDALNRCLVGIRLPQGFVTEVANAQMLLRRRLNNADMRWTPPGEVAVVLATLGELTPYQMQTLTREAAEVCALMPPITVSLGGWMPLPNATMPKEVGIGFTGDTRLLVALQAELAKTLQAHELNAGWRAGIELGKVRSGSDKARGELGTAVRMSPPVDLGSFEVRQAEFWMSVSTGTGPELKTVANLPFEGRGL